MVLGAARGPQLAFIFHYNCWHDFMNYFEPGKISLIRVFEVCISIASKEDRTPADLGTTLGWALESVPGMQIWDRKGFGRKKDLLVFHLTGNLNNHIQRYGMANFNRAFAKLPSPLRNVERNILECLTFGLVSSRSPRDIFSRFNFDILFVIVKFLSVRDALSLCSVSPATYSARDMLKSQSFWKSRFWLDGEVGYLNFLLQDETKLLSSEKLEINWQKVYYRAKSALPGAVQYQRTRDIHHFFLFQGIVRKEKKLWERLWWLKNRCMMIRFPAYKHNALESSLSKNLEWEKAGSNTRWYRYRDHSGWLSKGHQRARKSTWMVILHPSLFQIKVWVLADGKSTHIIGMEFAFRDEDRPNRRLGYHIPTQEIVVNIDSPKDIRRLDIHSSNEGIQALRFLGAQATTDTELWREITPGWIGSASSDKFGDKLHSIPMSDIIALEARFDVRIIPPEFEYMTCSNEAILALQDDWHQNWEI